MFRLPRWLFALGLTAAITAANTYAVNATDAPQDYIPRDGVWHFPRGFCTWYAATEFSRVSARRVNFGGHAGTWIARAESKGWQTSTNIWDARPGAIVVWSGGSFGHVAIVRQVSGDCVVVDEMNGGRRAVNASLGKTEEFGVVVRRTYSITRKLRRGPLTFAGLILPDTEPRLATN